MNTLPVLTEQQQKLVQENTSLVYFVARPFRKIPPDDYEDLCGRLFLRLCKSIAEFDPSLGFKLSSYVVKCLSGEAKNFFRDDIWIVKPPRRLRENSLSELLDTVEGSPSEAEVQGENPDKIRTSAIPLSLDTPWEVDGEEFVADVLVSDLDVEEEVLGRVGDHQLLREIFEALREEERVILALILREVSPAPRLHREARLKGAVPEVMERFHVGRTDAQDAVEEVREKVEYYHHRIAAGYGCPPSHGSEALTAVMKKRWAPPTLGRSLRRSMVEV